MRTTSRTCAIVVDEQHERPARGLARTRALEERLEIARACTAGDHRACRRPGRGRGRTTSGSCSGRRPGTSPPGRESASRSRRRQLDAALGSRAPSPRIYPKVCLLYTSPSTGSGVTVEPGFPAVGTLSVRSSVTVSPGLGVVLEGLARGRCPSRRRARRRARRIAQRVTSSRRRRRRRSRRSTGVSVLTACSRPRRAGTGGTLRPRRSPTLRGQPGVAACSEIASRDPHVRALVGGRELLEREGLADRAGVARPSRPRAGRAVAPLPRARATPLRSGGSRPPTLADRFDHHRHGRELSVTRGQTMPITAEQQTAGQSGSSSSRIRSPSS